jgi:alpha-tubulin suppressor-like RCC1 family protein
MGCAGQVPETCVRRGGVLASSACTGAQPVCMNGACAQCSPNANRCSGNAVQTCGADGSWGNRSICPGLCFAGQCKEAVAIAVGGDHTCALLSGGMAKCWGDNTYGQLGNGTMTSTSTPALVSQLTGATAIAAGGSHTCALLPDGTVECWGNNFNGQVGTGMTTTGGISMPLAVSNLTGATAIAAGNVFTCALLSDGTVECWGFNVSGELGTPTTTTCYANGTSIPCSLTPLPVSSLAGVTAVAADQDSACALLAGGTVQCWGKNTSGQLGNTTTTLCANPNGVSWPCSRTPVPVSNLTGVAAIAVGADHSCALLLGGTVACWGDNTYGQLGNGTTRQSSTPVPVSNLTGVIAITASCAVLSDGTVDCWGATFDNGMAMNTSTPVPVSRLSSVTAIAGGAGHICALLSGGWVECWGSNASGQLGSMTTTTCPTGPCSLTPVWVSW